jgi:hypothetical protein
VHLPLVLRSDADSPSPASETLSFDPQGAQNRADTPGFKTAIIAPLREDIVCAGGNLLNEKLSPSPFMGKSKQRLDDHPFRLLLADSVGLLVLLAETRDQFPFQKLITQEGSRQRARNLQRPRIQFGSGP